MWLRHVSDKGRPVQFLPVVRCPSLLDLAKEPTISSKQTIAQKKIRQSFFVFVRGLKCNTKNYIKRGHTYWKKDPYPLRSMQTGCSKIDHISSKFLNHIWCSGDVHPFFQIQSPPPHIFAPEHSTKLLLLASPATHTACDTLITNPTNLK